MGTETPSSRSASPETASQKPAEGATVPRSPDQPQTDARGQREQLSKTVEAKQAADPASQKQGEALNPNAPGAPKLSDKPTSVVLDFLSKLLTPSVIIGAVSTRLRERGLTTVADFLDQFLGVDTRLLSEALTAQGLSLKGWFIPVWNLSNVFNQVKLLRRDLVSKDQFFREVAANLHEKLGSGADVPFEAVLVSAQEILKKAQTPQVAAATPGTQPSSAPNTPVAK